MDDFERFWQAYPRRIGKGAARKAFAKAIELCDIDRMLIALEDYKRLKPESQPYCHPRTWLSQERWDDEYEAEQPTSIQGIALREAGHGSFHAHGGTLDAIPSETSGSSNIVLLSPPKRQF